MEWQILHSGSLSAEENMNLDRKLLGDLALPILRFYNFSSPSATFGMLLDPKKQIKQDACKRHGITCAKRPTGGGLLFHLTDFTFSVLLPKEHPRYSLNTLENYHFVNRVVQHAIEDATGIKSQLFCQRQNVPPRFCMAEFSFYDVIIAGRKVAGGAQRKTRKGFLHQGTISLSPLPFPILKEILLHPEIADRMSLTSYYLQEKNRQPLTEALIKSVIAYS